MHQIDNPTVASSIPASTAAGLTGFFTDGDPVLNVPATVLPAEFMNMLMMELLNVLATAGVTPSKTNFTQLAFSVNQLVRSGAALYGIDTGSANVYTVAYTPAISVATDGMVIRFKSKTTNTGPCTFAPDAVAANPLIGLGAMPLQGGEIVAGGTCTVVWLTALGKWVLLGCTGGSIQTAPGSASAHVMTIAQMQAAYGLYAADTGLANAYTVALSPAIVSLTDGMRITFQALTTNTSTSTLNVNGLGAKPLVGNALQPLQGGEILATGKVEVIYHAGLDFWILWAGGGSPQVPDATKPLHAVNFNQAQGLVSNAKGATYVTSNGLLTAGWWLVDTSGGPLIMTLPSNPITGLEITLTDAMATWAQSPLTLARNGKTIMGLAEDLLCNVSDLQFSIWYNGSDWRLV